MILNRLYRVSSQQVVVVIKRLLSSCWNVWLDLNLSERVHEVFLVVVVRVLYCYYFVSAARVLLSVQWAQCHAWVLVGIGGQHELLLLSQGCDMALALNLVGPCARLRDFVKAELLSKTLLSTSSKPFLGYFFLKWDTQQGLDAVLFILLIVDCTQVSPACALSIILVVT